MSSRQEEEIQLKDGAGVNWKSNKNDLFKLQSQS